VPDPHEPGSFLLATLESQPRELTRLLADGDSAARAAARLRECRRVFIAGTGTSYHGALAGQFMLRSAGVDAWAVRAFELANYAPALHDDDGLIVLSHRGSKRFSRESLDAFAARSHHWVAITGEGSPIEGDGVVRTVEQERSPVHTASHTGAMLRLAQIASALGRPGWSSQLADLPDAVGVALEWRDTIEADVRDLDLGPVVHFVGGGPARATAYEGALKLREASHVISAEGHDVEGVLHGPLVSIQQGQIAVLLAQPGRSLERMTEVAKALTEIGATILVAGAATDELARVAGVSAMDGYQTPEVDEVLAPIVNVIPLQWLAYHASRKVGVDADSFRRDEARYSAAQSKFVL
jgi:glutamine---fructose-6-phosphate transaminase (isomerizing)